MNTVFESVVVGIRTAEKLEAPKFAITKGGVISIDKLPENCHVDVYDLNGRLIKSEIASGSTLMLHEKMKE